MRPSNLIGNLTGGHDEPLGMLRSVNAIPDLVPDDRLFETVNECVAWSSRHHSPAGIAEENPS
jgi:hypothetical protein